MHLLNFLEHLRFLPEFSTFFSHILSIHSCFSCWDMFTLERNHYQRSWEIHSPCGSGSCCVWSFPCKYSSITSLGFLDPSLHNGLGLCTLQSYSSTQESSSQLLVLGPSKFLLVCMKKNATERKKILGCCPEGFCCLGSARQCQDACCLACSANSTNGSSRKVNLFPSSLFFIEFTCSSDKKQLSISSCSVCNSMMTWFYSRPQAAAKSKH